VTTFPPKYERGSFINTAYYNAIGRQRKREHTHGHVTTDDVTTVPLYTM